MKLLPALRQRLTAGVFVYVVVVTVLVATLGYLVNERVEQLVWESLLESELAHLAARRDADPAYRWTDTETLKLYGPPTDRMLPPDLQGLPPGVHDEVLFAGSQHAVLIGNIGGAPVALTLDIAQLEHSEWILNWTAAAWCIVGVVLLALVTYLWAGWLVRPLTSMAAQITSWSPQRSAQRIALPSNAPREAEIIASGLNDYAQRLEQFLDRERAFINTASHELRTPIAIISGAAEVALDRTVASAATSASLRHILHTAQDMEHLVSLLLALAKDPSRLHMADETIDLADLLVLVAQDHEHLAKRKELTLNLELSAAPSICAPRQIVRAAVGNLVRNAIENSDRGTITVSARSPAHVVVTDPGHGMSEAEMSAIYTSLARSTDFGDKEVGIGIDLITRLCDHLGWRLTFESQPARGTTARLDFESDASSLTETTFFRRTVS